MLYDYGPILNFDKKAIEESILYFKKHEDFFISSVVEVSNKYDKVQHDFDIFHPNVSFTVIKYPFEKDTLSIQANASISMNPNGGIVNALEDESRDESIAENTVVTLSNVERGVPFLSSLFLSKGANSHLVYWLYDTSSDSIPNDINNYSSDDILPFSVLSGSYYAKRLEFFEEIFSAGSSSGNSSIFTKYTGETFFNNLLNDNIYCSTENLSGDSISVSGLVLSFSNPIQISASYMIFETGHVFTDKSPASSKYGNDFFALKTLENVNYFMLREVDMVGREDEELITKTNFMNVSSILYDKTREYIDDNFKVEVSRDNDAATFKSIVQSLTAFLNSFYTDKIKLFLSNYVDFGAISELIEYIQGKIEELKSKFVENDECNIPLNSIDEGCAIDCEDIHLEEDNLMVTKQKLKSIIRCALMCDTMPYSEEDLYSSLIYQGTGDSGGQEIPEPPQ